MPTTTTTYSFNKPVVGADEDDWGGYLNGNWDSVDDLLDGTTPVTGIDINSGTIDNVVVGGATPAAGTFTTLTANTSITGTLATAAQPNITSVGTLTGLTVSASASLAGASTSADITFGDNDKAIFGAGSDLQIYHDGSHSYIDDAGTGNLTIRANQINFDKYTGEAMARFRADGNTELFYDNAAKLATTSTGIDVTGTVTADGLTVESGIGNTALLGVSTDSGTEVLLADQVGGVSFKNVNGDIELRVNGAASTAASTRLAQKIDGATGDISFYEDTGTTAKFFWDASLESVGIGTTSLTPTDGANIELSSATSSRIILDSTGTGGRKYTMASGTNGSLDFYDYDAAAYRMRIDSSGNVGIGTSSPNQPLHVIGNTQSTGSFLAGSSLNAATPDYTFLSDTSLGMFRLPNVLGFSVAGSERMRLDASGNLLVGVTSSSANMAGIELAGNGQLYASTSSSSGHFFNRQSTDGDIVSFRKDGTTVGSIGTTGGYLTVTASGGSDAGAKLGNSAIFPCNTDGSDRDAGINLGLSTVRWKDLYLSGGVYLGGVGAANKLDDYEESSFGLTTASDPTGSLDGNSYGYYVKVGSMVTVQIVFQCTANFTSNKIGDLPFVPINHSTVISTLHGGGVIFYGSSRGFVRVSNNDTKMYFTDTSGAAVNPSTSNDPFRFTLTYRTS